MSRHSFTAALVLALALSGCGTSGPAALASVRTTVPQASLQTASAIVAPGTSRATVTVQPGTAPERQHTALSTVTVMSTETMTDSELQDDAESLGFSIMSTATSKRGFVRRTAGGWALETTTGVFKKTTVDYTLTGTAGALAQVAARENKKTKITGTLDDAGTSIAVSTVASAMDLGVLTNWFTKGKFDGVVKDRTSRLPIAGATITATAASGGFQFTDTTTPLGEFAIKCLEPGTYTISITKGGYVAAADLTQALKARKKVDLAFDLDAQ